MITILMTLHKDQLVHQANRLCKMRNFSRLFLVVTSLIYAAHAADKCRYFYTLIQCLNADSSELVYEINLVTYQHGLMFVERIDLTEINFVNQTIASGWLNGITLKFDSLAIHSTNLRNIAPRAFSGRTFSDLTILVLSNNDIDYIPSGAFDNLRLSDFTFYNYDYRPLTIEKNSLGSLASTLHTLTIYNAINSESLLNITGPSTSLPKLYRLMIFQGDIENLQNDSFVGARNLRQLYLEENNITSIEEEAFDGTILDRLDLSLNLLTTLPKNLFRYVLHGISINDNPWRCDCDLVWLRDMYRYYPYMFVNQDFYCTTSFGEIPYQNVEFCSNSTVSQDFVN